MERSPLKVLAVVPARRGSKALPGKNMKPFCGRPLAAWSLIAASEAEKITKIAVSTDWKELADLSESYGVPVPWLRNPELATDTSSTVEVVLDVIDRERVEGREYDLVIVLEPTAPLRKIGDIDHIISILATRWVDLDSVVTAFVAPFHPSALRKRDGDYWTSYCEELLFHERRQDGVPALVPVGHTFAIKPEVLETERTFYSRRGNFFEVQDFQTVEIDREIDFVLAEVLFSRHRTDLVGGLL